MIAGGKIVACVLQHARHTVSALCIALGLASAPSASVAQQIAITIDDLPYVMPSRTTAQEGLAIVQAVNEALAKHDIQAVGFAIGRQVNKTSRPALSAFANAGHEIANHSWSHPDYGTLSAQQFQSETYITDRALADWMHAPKYYRFPYLKEGENEATKLMADRILAEMGYRNVPVSIDNDEWRYNAEYLDALDRGDRAAADQVALAYLQHMKDRTAHFQALAIEALGRDVSHILLLHMNKINADHLSTLLQWYADTGWTFISVAEALEDPLYDMPDLYAGPRGLSQLERITGRASE